MTLLVENLPSDMELDELKTMFESHGRCKVDKSNVFAYIEYSNVVNAGKALKDL